MTTAHEKGVRSLQETIIQGNLIGSWELFQFLNEEEKAYEIKKAPMVVVDELKDKVFSTLDEYAE